ncbi:MAG: hypothetical protein D6753_01440 [Planctomycetota bacterium]|nr:MAG: hypothetical protein D6753_01440 [Planctomycetota bacterium]
MYPDAADHRVTDCDGARAFPADDFAEQARKRRVKLMQFQIPREFMDRQAVDKGDVGFFEVAYRDVAIEQKPSPQPMPWRSSGGKVTAENAAGAERKGGRTEED